MRLFATGAFLLFLCGLCRAQNVRDAGDDICTGWGYQESGAYQEALFFYRRALNHGTATKAEKRIASRYSAVCHVKTGDFAKGRRAFAALMGDDPEHATHVLEKMGNLAKLSDILQLRSPAPKAAPTPEPVRRPTELERKLETIILPNLKFKNLSARQVVEKLRALSRKHDPAGKGVNIHLLQASSKERPATMTVDFDNIPLIDAIRYVAEEMSLVVVQQEHGVLLHDANISPEPLRMRSFAIDPRLFVGGDEDQEKEVDYREWFEMKGVTYPEAADGTNSFCLFNKTTSLLWCRNTEENLCLMRRMLAPLGIVYPPTMLRFELIESNAESEEVTSYKALKNLPHTTPCVLSIPCVSGEELLADIGALEPGNPRNQLRYVLVATPDSMWANFGNTEFAWTSQRWTPGVVREVIQNPWEDEPLLRERILRTKLVQTEGGTQLLNLQPQMGSRKGVYLAVSRSTLTRDGWPRHPEFAMGQRVQHALQLLNLPHPKEGNQP